METNSNSYIAGYQVPSYFSVLQYVLTLTLSHPSGIPMGTPPVNYYKGKHQGFKLSFVPPQDLPINSIIQIKLLDDNKPIRGSLVIQLKNETVPASIVDITPRPKFLTTYRLNSNDEIKIQITEQVIKALTNVHIIFRVQLTTKEDTIKPQLNIWTNPDNFPAEDPLYYGTAAYDVYAPSTALLTSFYMNS